MTLKFLGRGSAFNTKEGNTAAYIKENDTLFLIDCGSNIFERIISKNLLDGVKNVYVAITHRHPDHIGSLGDLVFYCFYKMGIVVNIFNSDYSINDYLFQNGITTEKTKSFDFRIPEMDLHISSIYANHCGIYQNAHGSISEEYCESDNPKDLFPCHSFRIAYKDKDIFYSGDCNYVDFWWNRGFDEYYIDSCFADYPNNVHYNIDKLYKDCFDTNRDVKSIWCMHFDCDEAISRAKEIGFNVVEVE